MINKIKYILLLGIFLLIPARAFASTIDLPILNWNEIYSSQPDTVFSNPIPANYNHIDPILYFYADTSSLPSGITVSGMTFDYDGIYPVALYCSIAAWNPATITWNLRPNGGSNCANGSTGVALSGNFAQILTDGNFYVYQTGANTMFMATSHFTVTYTGGPTPTPTETPTPTPTPVPPTPTPTPGTWDTNWMYNPGEYHWSSDFLYVNSMVEAGSAWVDPITAFGYPNSRYGTISSAGSYQPLRGVFEWYDDPPPAWGQLSGLRLDIMGRSLSNLQIRIQDYPNGTYSCTTGEINTGSVLQHNYFNITSGTCNSTMRQGLRTALINGNLEAKITYYYGSQTMAATIDSVAILPIFENGPWNFTATNSSQLIIPIAGQNVNLEDCSGLSALDKFSCNMRNWFSDQINKVFGINQSFAETKYLSLKTLMNTKIPFGYINAMSNLDLGSAASSSAIPDVAFNYTSKYKGETVFNYDFLVHGTDLPDTSAIRTSLRTVITIVLWIGFIWFIVRYWRVLF